MPVGLDTSAVPAGTRVLQIGPFKTGTTAIQHAAASQREAMRELGVLYPGSGLNHRRGCSALVGLTWGWGNARSSKSSAEHGKNLTREIERAGRKTRVWISYERLATLDDHQARELCRRVGGDIHVVVGLRPLAQLLPSEWQQLIKSGRRPGSLDEWARSALGDALVGGSRFRQLDHATVVERWADVVGPQSVTCVVVDRLVPERLPRAMEQILGLPAGLLTVPDEHEGVRTNRSLSIPEARLVEAVADVLREHGVSYTEYSTLIKRGMVERGMLAREPLPGETRPRLGPDVARYAADVTLSAAEHIGTSGVRVIGEMTDYASARVVAESPAEAEGIAGAHADAGEGHVDGASGGETIPLDLAVRAVVGVAKQRLDGVRAAAAADAAAAETAATAGAVAGVPS
jgi:hypothetical protein